MKILLLQKFYILKTKHSRTPQNFWGNMTKLPSNDEITRFDGTFLVCILVCTGTGTNSLVTDKSTVWLFFYGIRRLIDILTDQW